MASHNRIDPTSITPTVSRQTPKNEFGEVLAASLGQVARSGGMLLSGVTSASPVASAAVAAIGSIATAVTAVGTRTPRTLSERAPLDGNGNAWDLLQAQSSQTEYYLALQNEMQRESREFNTLSNVMKVRHDSAKAAINNIR